MIFVTKKSVTEIEAWYLSGVNIETCTIKLSSTRNIPNNTNQVTKETFESYFERLNSLEAKLEIVECFDIELAKSRNDSFQKLLSEHVE